MPGTHKQRGWEIVTTGSGRTTKPRGSLHDASQVDAEIRPRPAGGRAVAAPIVSKVGSFTDWPLILIDLYTEEGVVGCSYLEPYLKQSARYIVPVIEDLAEAAKGQPVAPFDAYRRGVGSLHLVGRRE